MTKHINTPAGAPAPKPEASRRAVLGLMTGAGVSLVGGGAVALAANLPAKAPRPTPRLSGEAEALGQLQRERFAECWRKLTPEHRQLVREMMEIMLEAEEARR